MRGNRNCLLGLVLGAVSMGAVGLLLGMEEADPSGLIQRTRVLVDHVDAVTKRANQLELRVQQLERSNTVSHFFWVQPCDRNGVSIPWRSPDGALGALPLQEGDGKLELTEARYAVLMARGSTRRNEGPGSLQLGFVVDGQPIKRLPVQFSYRQRWDEHQDPDWKHFEFIQVVELAKGAHTISIGTTYQMTMPFEIQGVSIDCVVLPGRPVSEK